MASHQIAQGLAGLGRHGDSTLVHMQPQEVAGLQAIAKAQGTSLTINPDTGLPEAFSLGGFFKSLLPTIAGFAAAGMSGGAINPLTAGMIAGAGTGALINKKDPLMGAVTGGLGGYGGAGLFNVGAAMPGQAANFEASMGLDKAYTAGQGAQAATSGFENAMGLSGAYNAGNPMVAQAANTAGTTASDVMLNPAAQQSLQNQSTNMLQQGIGRVAGSAGNLADVATFQPGAWDAFTGAGGSMMKAALPVGGAVLGGLEPTDLYGNPMQPGQNPNEKYDPYRTLNLNTNTGLKLYAQGGPVSFADGGDANKQEELSLDPAGLPGGGIAALQGAGEFEVTPGGPAVGLFATPEQLDAAMKRAELEKAIEGRRLPGLGIGTGLDRNNPTMASIGQFGRMNGGMGSSAPTMATMGVLGRSAQTAETAAPKYNYLERLNLDKKYAEGGITDLSTQSDTPTYPNLSQDGYGIGRLNNLVNQQATDQAKTFGYAKGGYLDGPGDGMSDSIPATIEGKQKARLADGEFVVPADVVSHLGNGSTKAGAKRLYGMMDKVRKARTGTKKQGKQINPNKYLLA